MHHTAGTAGAGELRSLQSVECLQPRRARGVDEGIGDGCLGWDSCMHHTEGTAGAGELRSLQLSGMFAA